MRPRAAESALRTRLSATAPLLPAKGPVILSSIFGVRLQCHHIGDIGECYETFELVIAVSAAAEHPQCQINFGRSLFE